MDKEYKVNKTAPSPPAVKSPPSLEKEYKVKALYDFTPVQAEDLGFSRGDYLIVSKHLDQDWCQGRNVAGVSGVFPRNYVDEVRDMREKKISQHTFEPRPPAVPSIQERAAGLNLHETLGNKRYAKALDSFPGEEPGDLSFVMGDILCIVEDIDSNWMKGYAVKEEAVLGIFPATFVKVLKPYEVPKDVAAVTSFKKAAVTVRASNAFTGPPPPPRRNSSFKLQNGNSDSGIIQYPLVPSNTAPPSPYSYSASSQVVAPPPSSPYSAFSEVIAPPPPSPYSASSQVVAPPPPSPYSASSEVIAPPPPSPYSASSQVVAPPPPSPYSAPSQVVPPPPPPPPSSHSSPSQIAPPPPPPSPYSSAPADGLAYGFSRGELVRPFSLVLSKEPPAPWYVKGQDNYESSVSTSTGGMMTSGAVMKTEKFTIRKKDRTLIVLEISQGTNDTIARYQVDVKAFVPPPMPLLELSANKFGPLIVQYCEKYFGRRVGNGECWTLGAESVKSSKCQEPVGTNFGVIIEYSHVRPGDILQFESAVFKTSTYEMRAGSPDHTAVVHSVISPNRFKVLEQNPDPVKYGEYDMSTLRSGTCVAYRPLPPAGIKLEDLYEL